MSENSAQDKTEAPTSRRIEKAREEGQIARSRELSSFIMLVVGVATLWIASGWMSRYLFDAMQKGLQFDHKLIFDLPASLQHCAALLVKGFLAAAPVMIALTITALLAPMLLGGWIFTTKSLAPDIKKLNPLSGIKRMFSMHGVSEMIKAVLKTGLIGIVVWFFVRAHRDRLLGLSSASIGSACVDALSMIAQGVVFSVLAFIAVVAVDVPYQLYSHYKKLKMSKEEIKREHKESEGDPHIKGKIRQQQQAMARRRMMAEVPKANVIVTNPTHYAAALRYQEGMPAPVLVAKGSDEVAFRIREVAAEHDIPILEAPPLARSLYHYCDLEHEIPQGLYAAVAEVLAWVYRLDQARLNGTELPDEPQDFDIPEELVDPQTRSQTS